MLLQIDLQLFLEDLGGEEAGAEKLVPDDVVLHAEGTGLVEGQPEGAVALGGVLLPVGGHLGGNIHVLLSLVCLAGHLAEDGEGGDTHNGL